MQGFLRLWSNGICRETQEAGSKEDRRCSNPPAALSQASGAGLCCKSPDGPSFCCPRLLTPSSLASARLEATVVGSAT